MADGTLWNIECAVLVCGTFCPHDGKIRLVYEWHAPGKKTWYFHCDTGASPLAQPCTVSLELLNDVQLH